MSLYDGGGSGHHELGRQLSNNNLGHAQAHAQASNNTGGEAGRRSVRIAESSVRKYLLLLHDCLAIKFVPTGPRLSPTDHQPFGSGSARSSGFGQGQGQRQARPSSAASNRTMTQFPGTAFGESVVPEVDNSLHGLCLFKGFREANLQCYWNSALFEAFRNLEYKGYILPSTVLIWAIPRSLATLRTAWARQMLRSPPGYRIEFIGEIEELIADPVQQSQFAPLSDSLCWAILEITSLGQEAFVDSILGALSAAFPTMVEPGRELVYQTLEKLIKERKVYQTAHGYFVVTPDTFRYMSSSNDHHSHYATLQPPPHSTMDMTLDALMTSPIPPPANTDSEEKVCFSRNSWDSTASAGSPIRDKEFGSEVKRTSDPPPLRRHNSLKIIRQKDKENIQSGSKTLGRRTLSFRLYKSKSTPNTGVSGKEKGSSREDESEFPTTAEPKVKSGKSFFRKLFKRSSSKGKKATASVERPTTPPPTTKLTASTSTSTSTATQTPATSPVDPIPRITETRIMDDDTCSAAGGQCGLSQLGYSTELLTSRWDSLPKPERPKSRVIDDGPHYATPLHPAPTPSRPNSMFNFQRGESSRCSTLSQGTSLGYGSQGPASLGFHSQSPTPSLSPSYAKSKSSAPPVVPNLLPRNSANYNSYRSYYDFYRRRYPSYGSSTTGQPQSRTPTPLVPTSHCYETISNYPQQRPKPPEPKLPRESKSENKNTITIAQCPNKDPFTTTVTQNLKSTTNMELQFRLPLGKLGQGNSVNNGTCNNKFTTTTRGSEPTTTRLNVNVGGGDTKVPSRANTNTSNTTNGTSTTISVGQSQPKTAVKTTVNHNGIIETHFDCSDDNKSSVEIELSGNNRGTNVFLVNSKSGERQQLLNGGQSKEPKAYRKISDIGLYRNSNGYPPVRVTDICKDSEEEFM